MSQKRYTPAKTRTQKLYSDIDRMMNDAMRYAKVMRVDEETEAKIRYNMDEIRMIIRQLNSDEEEVLTQFSDQNREVQALEAIHRRYTRPVRNLDRDGKTKTIYEILDTKPDRRRHAISEIVKPKKRALNDHIVGIIEQVYPGYRESFMLGVNYTMLKDIAKRIERDEEQKANPEDRHPYEIKQIVGIMGTVTKKIVEFRNTLSNDVKRELKEISSEREREEKGASKTLRKIAKDKPRRKNSFLVKRLKLPVDRIPAGEEEIYLERLNSAELQGLREELLVNSEYKPYTASGKPIKAFYRELPADTEMEEILTGETNLPKVSIVPTGELVARGGKSAQLKLYEYELRRKEVQENGATREVSMRIFSSVDHGKMQAIVSGNEQKIAENDFSEIRRSINEKHAYVSTESLLNISRNGKDRHTTIGGVTEYIYDDMVRKHYYEEASKVDMDKQIINRPIGGILQEGQRERVILSQIGEVITSSFMGTEENDSLYYAETIGESSEIKRGVVASNLQGVHMINENMAQLFALQIPHPTRPQIRQPGIPYLKKSKGSTRMQRGDYTTDMEADIRKLRGEGVITR